MAKISAAQLKINQMKKSLQDEIDGINVELGEANRTCMVADILRENLETGLAMKESFLRQLDADAAPVAKPAAKKKAPGKRDKTDAAKVDACVNGVLKATSDWPLETFQLVDSDTPEGTVRRAIAIHGTAAIEKAVDIAIRNGSVSWTSVLLEAEKITKK